MSNIRFKRGASEYASQAVEPAGVLFINTDNHQLHLHDGVTPGGHRIGLEDGSGSIFDQIRSLGIEDIDGLELAIAGMALLSTVGKAGGIAQLNSGGLLSTEHLPGWAETIVEIENAESLPSVGEVGKLYLAKQENVLYRWSGTQERYYLIGGSIESTDGLSQGQVNFYYTDSAVREGLSAQGDLTYNPETGTFYFSSAVKSLQGLTGDVVVGKAEIGLGNVENLPMAGEAEMEAIDSDEHYATPAVARSLAELIGLSEEGGQWSFRDNPMPDPGLKGVWTRLADGPATLCWHAAAAVEGKLYVYGGSADGTNAGIIPQLSVYDPAEDSWRVLGEGPRELGRHAAVELNGKLHVIGGRFTSSTSSPHYQYDPQTDEWTTLRNIPAGRLDHSAVVMDGFIYAYAGVDHGNTVQNTLYRYDPSEDAWTSMQPGPSSRYGHSAAVVDGKMYVFGGFASGASRNDLHVYDPNTDSWEQLADGPAGSYLHTAVAVDGKIYIHGGQVDAADVSGKLWAYDPSTDQWEQMGHAPTTRTTHTAVVLEDKVYIHAGKVADAVFENDLWLLE